MYFKVFHILVSLIVSLAIVNCLDESEGSQCEFDGRNGTCVYAYRCASTIKDFENRPYPPICSVQGGQNIICCTDCELVANVSLGIPDPTSGGILWRNGQDKGWDRCIESIGLPYDIVGYSGAIYKHWNEEKKCHDLIPSLRGVSPVGGIDAPRGAFPHMALLGYGSDLDAAQWLCGGSVISERFILTAAHCISSPQIGPVTYAATGILKRSDPAEFWNRYKVKRIIPYPDYAAPSKFHDIALLETDKLIKYDRNTLPACLPYAVSNDSVALATGWGTLGHRKRLADTLQQITVNKFSDNECTSLYPDHRHLKGGFNSTTQMCYGDNRNPVDTCEGDSGGPLQVKTQKPNFVYTIYGVTSSGRACGFAGVAGLYTRVTYYVPWIESVVWP